MNELDYIPVSIDLQQLITPDQAWHFRIIPKAVNTTRIEFYAEDGFAAGLKNELEILTGKDVFIEKTSSDIIQKTIFKYYRKANNNLVANRNPKKITTKEKDDFLHTLIAEAKNLHSSDIHIETYEEKCRVRIRIDGLLIERYSIAKEDYPTLVNKIKIRANLDIAEKRLPQDGRIFFKDDGTELSTASKFDIRVSVLPTLHGEKVVLRILSNDATNIDIKKLGFSENDLSNYLEGVKKPHGIVLISGPTGSGKTTTLYATLKILNKEKTNILTIEDPIEYTLEGINQVQLKESIGLTFSAALRTFLRQDPDIIMLGEIRDAETAQMAIRAALTGHLVLSTIHTNSAWGTVSRLMDMGVAPYLIAGTLNTSVAQRLMRLLCNHCKEKEVFDNKLLPKSFKPEGAIFHHHVAKGCEHCYYTGYKGRKAIYEVIPIDHELIDHIRKNDADILTALKEKKIKSLSDAAFELFEKGETSLEEIYPVLMNG